MWWRRFVAFFISFGLLLAATLGCGRQSPKPSVTKGPTSAETRPPAATGFAFAPRVVDMEADLDAFEISIDVPNPAHLAALESANPQQLLDVLRMRLPPPEDRRSTIQTDGYDLVPGTHRVESRQLVFTPAEPLLPGRTYVIQSNPQNLPVEPKPEGEAMERWFTVPRPPSAIELWEIIPPEEGSVEPLVVNFGESSPATEPAMLSVLGEDEQPVEGSVTQDETTQRWEFTPASPWKSGEFRLLWQSAADGEANSRVFEVTARQESAKP